MYQRHEASTPANVIAMEVMGADRWVTHAADKVIVTSQGFATLFVDGVSCGNVRKPGTFRNIHEAPRASVTC